MAFSALEDLAHCRNVLWVVKVHFDLKKDIVVNKESISIDKLTKDRNLNILKMCCKRGVSRARFPDTKSQKSGVCVSLHCWQ